MIGYERFNQLLAVAAANSKDTVNQLLVVKRKELTVSFSNYVKSQVHLNISGDLGGYCLGVFVEALHYLNHQGGSKESALLVLKQFYSDMANFLIKNPNRVKLHVVVDADIGCEEAHYDIGATEKAILDLCSMNSDDNFSGNDFSEIIDYAEDAEDLRTKSSNYAIAAVLLNEAEYAQRGNIRKVRFS